MEKKSDAQIIKELKQRNRELERIVGQKQILIDFKDKQIEIAEEMYQVDIKKKYGLPPSTGTGETGNETSTASTGSTKA